MDWIFEELAVTEVGLMWRVTAGPQRARFKDLSEGRRGLGNVATSVDSVGL